MQIDRRITKNKHYKMLNADNIHNYMISRIVFLSKNSKTKFCPNIIHHDDKKKQI
jgi:hypothetical protein